MAIHPTATIDRKAELDGSVEVGPYCVIDGHVRVAAGCRLYHNVYLTGWTEIGEGCELHPGAIVGHLPQDTKFSGERSYCRIGRRTVLREYVTVHRGTVPESETAIGEECFLLVGSHVAHNCMLGRGVTLINNVLLGGYVQVGDTATLGGASVVHQFVRIGELAMVAGSARVVQDVLPFALVGLDGRIAGLNRVGLRRAQFSQEQIKVVREAYRALFASGLPQQEAIARLENEPTSPTREKIISFLQGISKRGIAGRTRARRKMQDPISGPE